MKPLARIAFLAILLTASDLAAANCEGMDQYELRVCAQADSEKTDRELNQVYRELRRVLAEVLPEEGKPSSKEVDAALVLAERAWVAFRDAECDYDFALGEGGTGTLAPLAANLCVAELNRARTVSLRKRISELRSM